MIYSCLVFFYKNKISLPNTCVGMLFSKEIHALMTFAIYEVCSRGMGYDVPPILGLPKLDGVSDEGSRVSGHISAIKLLTFLRDHLTTERPLQGSTEKRLFCGPDEKVGTEMTSGDPFIISPEDNLPADLVKRMKEFLIIVTREMRKLNNLGIQEYLPWHVVQGATTLYLSEFKRILRFNPIDVPCTETKGFHIGGIRGETEMFVVPGKYSVEYVTKMNDLFQKVFVTHGDDILGECYGRSAVIKLWINRLNHHYQSDTIVKWVPVSPEPTSVEPLEDEENKHVYVKKSLVDIQSLIDGKLQGSISDGDYLRLVNLLKDVYDKTD